MSLQACTTATIPPTGNLNPTTNETTPTPTPTPTPTSTSTSTSTSALTSTLKNQDADPIFQARVAENAAFIALIESMKSGGYVLYLKLPAPKPAPTTDQNARQDQWWKDCYLTPGLDLEGSKTLSLIGYAMLRIGPYFREVRMGETCAALDAAVGLNLPYANLQRPILNPADVLTRLGQTDATIKANTRQEFINAVKGGGNILLLGSGLSASAAPHQSLSNLSAGQTAVFQVKKNEITFVRTVDVSLWLPYAKRIGAGLNLPKANDLPHPTRDK